LESDAVAQGFQGGEVELEGAGDVALGDEEAYVVQRHGDGVEGVFKKEAIEQSDALSDEIE
jgi:hypothetical protein